MKGTACYTDLVFCIFPPSIFCSLVLFELFKKHHALFYADLYISNWIILFLAIKSIWLTIQLNYFICGHVVFFRQLDWNFMSLRNSLQLDSHRTSIILQFSSRALLEKLSTSILLWCMLTPSSTTKSSACIVDTRVLISH